MTNDNTSFPKLYSINEAAKIMGIARSTLYNLATAGSIKIIKIGEKSLVAHANIVDVMTNGAPIEYSWREKRVRQRKGVKQEALQND